MNPLATSHIGNNIRCMRLLRGIKQTAFAAELGIAQQNVSKMEKKNKISDEQLKDVAKILNTTAEAIKNFDEKVIVNNSFLFNDQINHPVKEVIDYFKQELNKKDEEITRLKAELKGNPTPEKKSVENRAELADNKKLKAVQ